MNVQITPTCASITSARKCASRPIGTRMTGTLTYDASGHMFVPTAFGFGEEPWLTFPTTSPAYALNMVVAPSCHESTSWRV
jgi:hypothetical protein